jgi:hypothetical protein
MEIRIPRIQTGTNEENTPIMSPASDPPRDFTACEITPTEYVYQVPDREVPAQ